MRAPTLQEQIAALAELPKQFATETADARQALHALRTEQGAGEAELEQIARELGQQPASAFRERRRLELREGQVLEALDALRPRSRPPRRCSPRPRPRHAGAWLRSSRPSTRRT